MTLIKTNSNRIRYILLICYLFSVQFYLVLQAQQVRSGKSSIHINNIKTKETTIDVSIPIIKIISPDFDQKEKIKTNLPEITIIGKITDSESGIKSIYINSKENKLNEDGLFVQKILLKKGDNKIKIFAIDKKDNYFEKNLIVEHISESKLFTAQLNIAGKYYIMLY